jgi:hypothetical protein
MNDWPKCWRVRSIPAIYGLDRECDLCTPHGKGESMDEGESRASKVTNDNAA